MELNAEQIKKRLEYVSKTLQEFAKSYNIPETPIGSTARNAHALILAYEEQIQELTEDIEWSAKRILEADKKVAELTEENERLKNLLDDRCDRCDRCIERDRADTVREMRSILYEEFLKVARCQKSGEPNMKSQEVFAILDQIAQEMLGDK